MPDGGRLLVTDRSRRQLGVAVPTVERLVVASRPDKRREARLTTCASYSPIGLDGWAASDPDSPFHLTGAICRKPLLLTCTAVVDSIAGQPAAEDEGVLK
jgi:hypothetical protein